MTGGQSTRIPPGKHTQSGGRAEVRKVSLAALIVLIAQYGLGTYLNLYVPIPAADQHAGIVQEIANGPYALTLHALVGVALVIAAIVLLRRAIRIQDVTIIVLAAVALAAIVGAFIAGEVFVHDGKQSSSFMMGMLTGVALLGFVATLALASASGSRNSTPTQERIEAVPHTLLRPPAGWPAEPVRDVQAPRPSGPWQSQPPPTWFSDH